MPFNTQTDEHHEPQATTDAPPQADETDTMPEPEVYWLTLSKPAQRALQERAIRNNTNAILNSINSRALKVRGWELSEAKDRYGKWWKERYWYHDGNSYMYELKLKLTYNGTGYAPNDLQAILRSIATKGSGAPFGRWELTEVNDEPYKKPDDVELIASAQSDLGYAQVTIPPDWSEHFKHLYGLDEHIGRVRRALEAGILSSWNNRYHCALVGPPGCGKSDICQSIKRALGEDAVLEYDATATTSAGAIQDLTERDVLPRVLLVEEIEKADEKAIQFLLGVLDLRASIRKTTARNKIERDAKLFAVCTVNDVPLFNRMAAGALASRFSNTIWFKRPTREQLEKILSREVGRVGGDLAWIDPALDYCEVKGISDPRKVTAICLCGRDMLVSGEYQAMLEATNKPIDAEDWISEGGRS